MSELTKCNACTLERIKQRAEADGKTVKCRRRTNGEEMPGWYAVTIEGDDTPCAWFMELTLECCC